MMDIKHKFPLFDRYKTQMSTIWWCKLWKLSNYRKVFYLESLQFDGSSTQTSAMWWLSNKNLCNLMLPCAWSLLEPRSIQFDDPISHSSSKWWTSNTNSLYLIDIKHKCLRFDGVNFESLAIIEKCSIWNLCNLMALAHKPRQCDGFQTKISAIWCSQVLDLCILMVIGHRSIQFDDPTSHSSSKWWTPHINTINLIVLNHKCLRFDDLNCVSLGIV